MSEIRSDLIQQAETYGYSDVGDYLDVIFQELSHGVTPVQQKDEVLNQVDDILLARSLPEEALRSSDALVSLVNKQWSEEKTPVFIHTERDNDDKISRAISVYESVCGFLGDHIGRVTVDLVFNDDQEPAGWNIRPRGVTPAEVVLGNTVSLTD